MISILVPSRRRPDSLREMYQTALETASGDIECVVYVDDDDDSYEELVMPNLIFIRGPRIVLSEMWNECWYNARGQYFLHAGDDIRFRTKEWDKKILSAFPEDKIAFVHGRDGSPQDDIGFGTHGFLNHKWTDAVGYFVPPYFSCDYNDTWLNDVADRIHRHIVVDDVLIEHLHPVWGKRQQDEVDEERVERGAKDNVKDVYIAHDRERQNWADTLVGTINGS